MRREKRKEQFPDESGFVIRYLVFNGDRIGSYGVMFAAEGRPFGASRDYHEIAPADAMERYERYQEWVNDEEDRPMPEKTLGIRPQACEYHDGKLCVCDGSSLVQVTTDDEEAFKYAEMMAGR